MNLIRYFISAVLIHCNCVWAGEVTVGGSYTIKAEKLGDLVYFTVTVPSSTG